MNVQTAADDVPKDRAIASKSLFQKTAFKYVNF